MFKLVSKNELNSLHKDTDPKQGIQNEGIIKDCILHTNRLQENLQKVHNLFEHKEFEEMYGAAEQCVKKSTDLCQMIRSLLISFGDPDGYGRLKNENIRENSEESRGVEEAAASSAIQFEELGDAGIKIILPDLLPKRINYKNVRNKTVENLDYIRYGYLGAFSQYFDDKHYTFDNRVVILYKHIYASEKFIRDDDNFDYKIITDLIAEYVLVDDSPKYCMKIFDYGMGETNHSEISIFPVHEWLNYVEVPFH